MSHYHWHCLRHCRDSLAEEWEKVFIKIQKIRSIRAKNIGKCNKLKRKSVSAKDAALEGLIERPFPLLD